MFVTKVLILVSLSIKIWAIMETRIEMRPEIITANLMTEKPISGEYLERQYMCSTGTNTWVLFSGACLTPWVGVFGNGVAGYFSCIAQFYGTNVFLIIASGQGYIINATDGRLLRRTKWDYSYSCLTVPERSFILVADNSKVWACYLEKDVFATVKKPWFTSFDESGKRLPPEPREFCQIALDGLVFDNLTDNKLLGKAWWLSGWYDFQIDLKDMKASIGKELVNSQWDAFEALPGRGGFPLSKEYIKHMSAYRLE
jgi:hypothetical protein